MKKPGEGICDNRFSVHVAGGVNVVVRGILVLGCMILADEALGAKDPVCVACLPST
jgi:hypothetical protein